MRPGKRRSAAILACRILQSALPRNLADWGEAVRCEVEEIGDDTGALFFALGSLCGLAPRILLQRLSNAFAAPAGAEAHSPGGTKMGLFDEAMRHPRAAGAICATAAAISGLAYLALAGAPSRYLLVNVGALVLGLAMLAPAAGARASLGRWSGAAILAMALALLATALFGDRAAGAARWIGLGPVYVQPGLVLLPAMILVFIRSRDSLSTAGIAIAAAALAIQPDRATAAMLVSGLAYPALARPDRSVVAALACAVGGFGATMARSDALPAVPYVDQIFYSSFDVHVLAGFAVLGGAFLLLAPAIGGALGDDDREDWIAFGAIWLAAMLAAALGNYPTPVVGYGASAILGYLLSLAALPKKTRRPRSHVAVSPHETSSRDRPERHLYAAPGYPA